MVQLLVLLAYLNYRLPNHVELHRVLDYAEQDS